MTNDRRTGETPGEPLLRLEGISKSYGKVAAVEPLDLKIRVRQPMQDELRRHPRPDRPYLRLRDA
jgi:hypothetical protein